MCYHTDEIVADLLASYQKKQQQESQKEPVAAEREKELVTA